MAHTRKTSKGKRPVCSFCGGTHHSKRDYQKCREGRTEPDVADPVVAEPSERRPGTATTHYDNDPMKGNKRGHAVVRRFRSGWPTRKIASHYQISTADVEGFLKQAGLK